MKQVNNNKPMEGKMAKKEEKKVFNVDEQIKGIEAQIEQVKAQLYRLDGALAVLREAKNADERVFSETSD